MATVTEKKTAKVIETGKEKGKAPAREKEIATEKVSAPGRPQAQALAKSQIISAVFALDLEMDPGFVQILVTTATMDTTTLTGADVPMAAATALSMTGIITLSCESTKGRKYTISMESPVFCAI